MATNTKNNRARLSRSKRSPHVPKAQARLEAMNEAGKLSEAARVARDALARLSGVARSYASEGTTITGRQLVSGEGGWLKLLQRLTFDVATSLVRLEKHLVAAGVTDAEQHAD